MLKPGAQGNGALKGVAQLGGFNHVHASNMAKAAQARAKIAQVLGPQKPTAGGAIVAPSVAPVAPPAPQAAPANPAGLHVPHPKGNFKAHIAHAVHQLTGAKVTHDHVLSAIDSAAAQGQFTPFDAQALKNHTGPLVGEQGKDTMLKITSALLAPPKPSMVGH